MKKFAFALSVFILLVSCGTKNAAVKNNLPINQKDGKNLIGQVNRQGFEQPPFESWFGKNYRDYRVDKKEADKLKEPFKEIKLLVVMGTWCPDSRRETPRLYKILDYIGFDEKNLTVYAVDRSKRVPSGATDNLNIKRVPTIIVLKGGKEIGRIIEYPVFSLEKDLYMIISGQDYKPNYLELN